MRKAGLSLLALLYIGLCGCHTNTQTAESIDSVQIQNVSKLERFLTLPKDSVYLHCDLSGDSITEFPDLSEYTIRSLDLSNNQIYRVFREFLPKDVREINLSYNRLTTIILWRIENTIRILDLSHNQIDYISLDDQIKKLDVSHNQLESLYIWVDSLCYLNVSNNPKFSDTVRFNAQRIDTIIRHNIARDKPLFYFIPPPVSEIDPLVLYYKGEEVQDVTLDK